MYYNKLTLLRQILLDFTQPLRGLEIKKINHQGVDFFEMKKGLVMSKLISDKNYKLIIFLHPKEIRANMDLINIHYQKLLGQNANFEVSTSKLSSDQLFHLVDLGVAFNQLLFMKEYSVENHFFQIIRF